MTAAFRYSRLMTARNRPIELPACIAAYWTAANVGDSVAAASHFAADAVVHDEGGVYRTPQAIAAWIEETTRKHHPVVEPRRCEIADGRHRIAAKVSGTFPGSPVELDFEFTVVNEKITQLEIK
jgi:hypothetical protein